MGCPKSVGPCHEYTLPQFNFEKKIKVSFPTLPAEAAHKFGGLKSLSRTFGSAPRVNNFRRTTRNVLKLS